MDNTCIIDIADGIGNIIQSIPFVIEMKKKYKRVLGHNRPDFEESTNVVRHLYDGLVGRGNIPRGIKWYPIPNLQMMGSYPEYKSWFRFHKERMPSKFLFDVSFDKSDKHFDVCVWGGCKKAWRSKKWLYWDEYIDLLVKDNKKVAIVGLKGEGPNKDLNSLVEDYRGRLSLLETGGVIKNSGMFVGNEGGLSHYAAALGTNVCIIMGGTDPIKNLPLGTGENAIQPISSNLKCQPCQFGICINNPAFGCDNINCLKGLSASKVDSCIKTWLQTLRNN